MVENFKEIVNQGVIKIIIMIRCLSCGKPIAHLWDEFKQRCEDGEEVKLVLDELGLDRYCCRSQFMGHIDLIDEVARFKKA